MNGFRTRPYRGRARSRVARAVVPFLGLILATLSCPAPVLAGAFVASGWVGQEFYASGPPGVSSQSPTGATFTQQFVAGDVNLSSRAEASSGKLSLSAYAGISGMTRWDSGHVWSSATATIHESVAPEWALWNVPGGTLLFDYEVSVYGLPITTIAGYGAVGSEAILEYAFHLGDSSGAGNWSQNATGQGSQSGTWNGVIHSSFTVQKDSTFLLELLAHVGTMGTKNYSPGGNANIVASADFSHTMTWLGITGVRAFDSLGDEVPLPSNFSLPLMGRDSGFNYWHSAAAPSPEPGPTVPEPGTVGLFAAGVLALARTLRPRAPKRPSRSK